MDKTKLNKINFFRSFISSSNIAQITENNKSIFVYTKDNPEVWWNFAHFKKKLKQKDFEEVKTYFENRKRQQSIYTFDNTRKTTNIFKQNNYKIFAKDSYMLWNKNKNKIDNSNIIEVKTDKEFKIWINTFIKSYPKDDPKNPYGEQKKFAKILANRYKQNRNKNDKYYIAFEKNKPVSVGILNTQNKIGYLSGIGSIPFARGKGFGKQITLHCINESIRQGNKYHFLITEKGHFPFKFYNKLGFKEKFVTYLYSKQ